MVTAEIYYVIAGVVYTIFLIRIIALWTIGDFDFSFDTDFSLGDIISFKGLLHFLMGFAGYISLKYYRGDIPDFLDYIIASILGVIFIFILYFIYKLIYMLIILVDGFQVLVMIQIMIGYLYLLNIIVMQILLAQ